MLGRQGGHMAQVVKHDLLQHDGADIVRGAFMY